MGGLEGEGVGAVVHAREGEGVGDLEGRLVHEGEFEGGPVPSGGLRDWDGEAVRMGRVGDSEGERIHTGFGESVGEDVLTG